MSRGGRGATTVLENNKDLILSEVKVLLAEIVLQNHINLEDVAAVIFSSTADLTSTFPAVAARQLGWNNVPLFGTQEIDNPDSLQYCVRVLLLWNTDISQTEIKQVYLQQAVKLRPDLVGK